MSTTGHQLGKGNTCHQAPHKHFRVICLSLIFGFIGAASASTENLSQQAVAAPNLAAETQICLLANEASAQVINVELAMNNAERAQGLMMREALAENAGMLFVYPYTAVRSFWMYRTLLPLDIAFIDAQGVIVDIQQMQPCRSYWSNRCPNYPAAAPFLYALEVNLNSFSQWQVQVGDQVTAADCATPLAIHTPH